MEYVSPLDERTVPAAPLARRGGSLTGRRVVLLDISKRRSKEFLHRLGELLEARGATTDYVVKPAFSRPASRELIEEIALRGDLVVEGLAD